MCRLAYIGNAKKFDCQRLFRELEAAQGGDGNGVAWGSRTVKGVELPSEEAAQIARSAGEPVLFHTRMASSGPVCDGLCHPFETDHGWLAHNGCWGDWEPAFWSMVGRGVVIPKHISDTWVMSQLVNMHGPDILSHAKSGVWLLLQDDGTCLAYVQSGRLEIGIVKGAIVAASQIPEWLNPSAVTGDEGTIFSAGYKSKVLLRPDGFDIIEGKLTKSSVTKNVGLTKWKHKKGWERWDETAKSTYGRGTGTARASSGVRYSPRDCRSGSVATIKQGICDTCLENQVTVYLHAGGRFLCEDCETDEAIIATQEMDALDEDGIIDAEVIGIEDIPDEQWELFEDDTEAGIIEFPDYLPQRRDHPFP